MRAKSRSPRKKSEIHIAKPAKPLKTKPKSIDCPEVVKALDLPPQQKRCVALLLLDLRQHEIADRMGISERTVKRHLAEIRTKLSASSDVGIVLRVFGFVPKVPVLPPPVIG